MEEEHSEETAVPQPRRSLRRHGLFILMSLVLWVPLGLWYFFQPAPAVVEKLYSCGFYPVMAKLIIPVTSSFPFSLSLLMVAAAPFLFIVLWILACVMGYRRHQRFRWRGLLWGPKWLLFVIPLIWLWFLIFWGMGYARQPIEERLAFDGEAVSAEELASIKEGLFQVIDRDQPQEDSDRNIAEALASVSKSMEQMVNGWEGSSKRIPRRVKATPPGLLLMNGTSGVCAPFTLEPHVDGGLPDTWFVSVGAHELGHIAGVCDEGETNLISYIAGLQADHPYARYAVALTVYVSVANQLTAEERKEAIARLPEQARADIQAAHEAGQKYRIDWFQKWSWRAYNHYLKSQGVREGVRSYGRGTQLLVQAWRSGYLTLPESPSSSAAAETEEEELTAAEVESASMEL
ncbi:MAG: DUF3810 domain-containing protein [Candidatus Hydrogenedentes bacterium]|jgi:hypothetical protein|nr:DUF3810 domain-containing protein [Candidatus Hydrogenedentota bacterium]